MESKFVKPQCTETGKCCVHVENIIYFQAGEKGLQGSLMDKFRESLKKKIDPPLKEVLFYNSANSNPTFRMNGKFFIYFSKSNVEYFDIHEQLEKKSADQDFQEIRFRINKKETGYHYIKDVRCGSNPDIIAIIIQAREQC